MPVCIAHTAIAKDFGQVPVLSREGGNLDALGTSAQARWLCCGLDSSGATRDERG